MNQLTPAQQDLGQAGRERASEQAGESSPGSLDEAGWSRAGLTSEQSAITLNECPAVGRTDGSRASITCRRPPAGGMHHLIQTLQAKLSVPVHCKTLLCWERGGDHVQDGQARNTVSRVAVCCSSRADVAYLTRNGSRPPQAFPGCLWAKVQFPEAQWDPVEGGGAGMGLNDN